jgi:protein involved in polysaccharide export with SLBB domain
VAAGLAASLALLSGCYYNVTKQPLPAAQRSAEAPIAAPPYFLQIGDQIAVKFYQNQEFNEDVVIRPDGRISLQLIGDVPAAGLEPAALAAAIERAFASELSQPRVTVLVRTFGARVYIGGEVAAPKALPYFANLTLTQAVQEAGGFLDTAQLSQVVLIRRGPDGRPVGHAVDVRPIIGGIDPSQDVPLQPFDIAFVPRSKIADVDLFVQQYFRGMLPIAPESFLFFAF